MRASAPVTPFLGLSLLAIPAESRQYVGTCERAHGIVKDDTLIAAAMGNTVEVHHRSYRTTEWRSVRKAFAEAS